MQKKQECTMKSNRQISSSRTISFQTFHPQQEPQNESTENHGNRKYHSARNKFYSYPNHVTKSAPKELPAALAPSPWSSSPINTPPSSVLRPWPFEIARLGPGVLDLGRQVPIHLESFGIPLNYFLQVILSL
jgi:hypothetical protein